jgi:hypothetical protein
MLEILADTTYAQVDTTGRAFPQRKAEGVYYLSGDTLIVFPLAAPPDTFTVRIRFTGNYLELIRAADQRYTYYHKITPQDSVRADSLLGDSLWRLVSRRVDPGIAFSEPNLVDFTYARFSGDSMYTDVRRNGIIRTDSGRLSKRDSLWTWKAAGGEKAFIADLVHVDTLRLWTLTEGRPDSGFQVFERAFAHHSRDIDMRRLIGRLRSDSLVLPFQVTDYHYGRYYDWILGEDHKVSVETNITGLPMWTSWTLDSGYLALSSPQKPKLRMRVDTAGTLVRLRPDSSAFFPLNAVINQTLVDGSRFAAHPLERFQQASYLHLYIGSDTMAYYFAASNLKDRFEIAGSPATGGLWAGFLLGKTQETFQSSQPDFYLAFEARAPGLGKFTCRSRPHKDLVIRQTVSADPLMATGLIQGACEIQRADTAFTDSTLNLEGAFRIKRKYLGGFVGNIWNLP